jgi:hypothetical protein
LARAGFTGTGQRTKSFFASFFSKKEVLPSTREVPMPPAEDRLLGPGAKRILALDGGGTKGIIELAFLARIETLLREHLAAGDDFRLCDWFHLIGGTSTGAIIAAGLAMGKSVAELSTLYLALGPTVFRRQGWRVAGLMSMFNARPLQKLLRREFGSRTLDSPDLRTGLAIIAHRFDTGSPWLISNNPLAPYWDDPADQSYLGNRHYLLAEVVRASTAAPGYFEPQKIAVLPGGKPALFVDGGLTPHNNPAVMLLMMTQLEAFRLRWPTGRENLNIISIGAGHYRRGLPPGQAAPATAGGMAMQSLLQSLSTAQSQTLALLQWMGESQNPWPINSEIGDLSSDFLAGRGLFGFQRYDLLLEPEWLKNTIGRVVGEDDLARLRKLDQPEVMPDLLAMASMAAARQVRIEHLT